MGILRKGKSCEEKYPMIYMYYEVDGRIFLLRINDGVGNIVACDR